MSIRSELSLGVLTLTIDRPEKRNTISAQMFDTLSEAFVSAEKDDTVRVILIKGQTGIFSAGADLEEQITSPEIIDRAMTLFFETIATTTKPIVAQVSGPCVGDAFGILLYCDLVYAGAHALFSIPCVALARTPRFGVGGVITSAAGYPKAAEKLLLSEPISADEALAMRLITAIISDEELEKVVTSKVARLAVLPPQAVCTTKKIMRLARDRAMKVFRDEEEAAFLKQASSAEAHEALQAFMEGRKPIFRPEP